MNELLPQAPLDAPDPFDVVKVHDLLPYVQQLREGQRRWKRTALATLGLLVFVLVLSLLQLAGTVAAFHLLTDARREAKELNKETTQALQDVQQARQKIEAAAAEATRSAWTARIHHEAMGCDRAKLRDQVAEMVESEATAQKRIELEAKLLEVLQQLEAQKGGKKAPE